MDKSLVSRYLHAMSPISTKMKPSGKLRLPIKGLICDLYGTLFISGSGDIGLASDPSHQTAQVDLLLKRYGQSISAQALFQQLGLVIQAQHAMAKKSGADHPEVVIESIWKQLLTQSDLETIKRFAIEFEMITNPVWPMPGMAKLLSACVNSSRCLGIISNAQFYTPFLFQWLVGRDTSALGFDPELTIYSYQHGIAKPSRRLFDLARHRLEKRGISSDRVAYMGNDMRNDIVPAHLSGFQTILFAGDRRSLRLRKDHPQFQAIKADKVITHLDQLTSFLESTSVE